MSRAAEREMASMLRLMRLAQRLSTCGAKTRYGRPCRKHPATFANKRCELHGGLSTGPRTPEGKARIAAAQRRRWARWRGLTINQTQASSGSTT